MLMAATSFVALAVYAGCDRCGNTAARGGSGSGSAALSAKRAVPAKKASAAEQKRLAQRFFDHMRGHRFEKAYAMFEPTLAKVSNAAQLKKTWGELEQSLGGIKRVEPVKVYKYKGHLEHLYRCHGARAAGNVKVLTRARGPLLVGFFVTGDGSGPDND